MSLLDNALLAQLKLDSNSAERVLHDIPGSFIGGSYAIFPENAGDIDIIVSESVWSLVEDNIVSKYGFWCSTPDDMSPYQDETYHLHLTYRNSGCINLLICKDVYYTSYYAALVHMQAHPDDYEERESRIYIHQKMRGLVREMLENVPCI